MNRVFLSVACAAAVIAPRALHARDRAPAKEATPAPKDDVAPANVPPYVLKNTSKFDEPPANARVPFWPVGWSKQKQAAIAVAVAAPKATLDEKSFDLSSILIGAGTDSSFAVINKQSYGEGQFLRMPKGSALTAQIRVQRITDGAVTLQYGDQKIVVHIRRPELSQHKDEGELLLDPNNR